MRRVPRNVGKASTYSCCESAIDVHCPAEKKEQETSSHEPADNRLSYVKVLTVASFTKSSRLRVASSGARMQWPR